MDQEKIGKFIASCRKDMGLTQAALAEKLGITDRAVSKWENGKSMPDASIMLELCGILQITVNELLSGERLDMEDYKKMAEENLLQLQKQEELNNKKLLSLEVVIGYTSTISFMVLIFAASFAVTSPVWRGVMILTAAVIFAVGMLYCLRLEHDAGYYECPNCGKKYVPSMKAVVMAPHVGRNRRLRCPYCGKRGFHKKVLTK
jgi:transcriptional regulator with XRE-family HTH domain/DNA-directed RNA polymerase subunit RPC12/RpoP